MCCGSSHAAITLVDHILDVIVVTYINDTSYYKYFYLIPVFSRARSIFRAIYYDGYKNKWLSIIH